MSDMPAPSQQPSMKLSKQTCRYNICTELIDNRLAIVLIFQKVCNSHLLVPPSVQMVLLPPA